MARRPVRGDREAKRALRELGRQLGPPAAEAGRFALGATLRETKRLIPKDTGETRRNLIIRRARSPREAPHLAITARAPFYRLLHLIEFGRAPNAEGKGGYPGSRFMERAFIYTRDEILRRFNDRFGKAVIRRARRLRQRAGR